MMKQDRKDTVMIIAALALLASGVTLSFLSFFLSIEHEIANSVLWYFAQTLLYAASTFGLYSYTKSKLDSIELNLHKK